MTRLFKDGEKLAIQTDASDEQEFTDEFVKALTELIEAGTFDKEWSFQLQRWLPQYAEIVAAYRGYKANEVNKRTLYTTGGGTEPVGEVVMATPSRVSVAKSQKGTPVAVT